MENSKCRRLISLYKEYKCLWDRNDDCYTHKDVRDDAWRHISRAMGNKKIEDLKKKMRSLAGGYRRERFREKQSRVVSVAGAVYRYKSKWFAYDDFAFMAGKNNPGTTRDTLQHDQRQETRNSTNEKSIRKTSKRKYEKSPQIERESDRDSVDSNFEIETKPTPTFRVLEDNSIEPITTNSEPLETNQETPATNDEEDECDMYGKLLAYKLRKFKEEDRLTMMNDIDNLLFRARMKALSKKPCSQEDKDPFE